MQEDQLIAKLKELKNITPRKEWVVLAKIQILDTQKPAEIYAEKRGIVAVAQDMLAMIFPKKYAYAYAALAILMVGSVAVMQFPVDSGMPQASPAALVLANSNVEDFKLKSKELANVAKNDQKSFIAAVDSVKEAAKQLTETIQKEPGVAREIALEINNNKTYLNMEGSAELKSTLDDMYKNTVKPLLEDLEGKKDDLTKSQQEAMAIAKDLYENKRYTDALESILLLSMAMQDK